MPKLKSEGSIYQRKSDKKWVASVVVGKKENGSPNRKAFYGSSEREVKKKLSAFKAELEKGEYVNVIKTDLATYLRDWLHNELSITLKPKAYDAKEYVIEKIIIPYLGKYQVGSITRDDIQLFIKNISDKYARSTVKKAYDVLNQRFKDAIINRSLVFNPCLGVKLPRVNESNKKQIRFFSKEEMAKILDAADAVYPTGTKVCRLGKAIHLLYYTGLRPGEAIALTWDDIDYENKLINVNKNAVNVKNRGKNENDDSQSNYVTIIQTSTKTESGTRHVPMSSKTEAALKALQELNGDHKYVLAASTGRPITIRALEKMFHGIQSRAGVEEHGTLHSLRHTFASHMLESGVDVKVVADILGHSDVTVTYNTYIHVIKKMKMQAVSKLDVL